MALTPEVMEALKALAGPGGWSQDPSVLEPKLTEWRGRYHGATPLLLTPGDTRVLSGLLKILSQAGVPVVPQGGNTGLVGGQIPAGEVLLSLERMSKILEVSTEDDVLVAEAGATLHAVRAAAEAAGRFFPLSLASEGSCTVGGLISTNAGGVAVLRYGTMRALVLGVEAVLADGTVHHGLKKLRKDATGFDLAQAFIGAEGTLGVVTAASLRLFPLLPERATAVAGVAGPDEALALLGLAKSLSGGAVEAFELIGRLGVELARRNLPNVRDPLSAPHPYLVLIELAYPAGTAARDALQRVLEAGLEAGLVADAALAASEAQRAEFWALREGQSAAQKPEGQPWKHDVATPPSQIAAFIREAGRAVLDLEPEARVLAFGHVGDGNIHFDVLKPEGGSDARHETLRAEGARRVHEVARSLGGTISAEHGLGVMKSAEAAGLKDEAELRAYRALRSALDPGRILNPRVLF